MLPVVCEFGKPYPPQSEIHRCRLEAPFPPIIPPACSPCRMNPIPVPPPLHHTLYETVCERRGGGVVASFLGLDGMGCARRHPPHSDPLISLSLSLSPKTSTHKCSTQKSVCVHVCVGGGGRGGLNMERGSVRMSETSKISVGSCATLFHFLTNLGGVRAWHTPAIRELCQTYRFRKRMPCDTRFE